MTATEPTVLPPVTASGAVPSKPGWALLAFGTGLGVALGDVDLEIALVRSRPSGSKLAAATTIRDFRTRPAAQWGAEASKFLDSAGERDLAATVLLPRGEVIVRTVALPGVSAQDMAGAIELQVETLHPYGDEDVAFAWAAAGVGQALVGIVRKSVLDAYETLFSEAGIALAGITFSAAAIHSALRIRSSVVGPVLAYEGFEGTTEVYGESTARAVYSAVFRLPPERALAVARAELRLDPGFPAVTWAQTLGLTGPDSPPSSAPAWAVGLAASVPFAAKYANLLPKERRASNTRRQYVLPAILTVLLALALVVVFVIMPALDRRDYLAALTAETKRLDPRAARTQKLEKDAAAARLRVAALDDFRRRPQADLDVLAELTKLLAPPVWTSNVEIYPDSVVISGEADQAAPLLRLLDSSPLFQNSEFSVSVTRSGQLEQFRIKTLRRGRTGKTTP